MRGRWLVGVPIVAAMFFLSACGSGPSRSPAAPSTGISVVQAPGTMISPIGASSVSWSCFSRVAGTAGTFGSSGCTAARVTTSRFLPASGAPLNAPSAPTNLSATVNGSTVTLNWSAPVGGDAATSYIVQAGSAAGLSDLASFDTGSPATSLVVVGVPAGTYFVRVRANNAAGSSGASNEFQLVVTGASPCGSLLPPTGLSASVNGTTVVLTWAAPSGCAPASYVIQAGSTPGASNLASFSTGSTATTFVTTGVGPGTYYIRVLSEAAGVRSAPSAEIAFVVGGCATPPNPPANLAGSVSGSTVTLTWSASTGSCPASSYLVQAGSSSGASNLGTASVAGTSLTAAGLGNGTYYIRVYGVNAAGQSGPSNEILVTIGPVTPTTVFASFQFFDPAWQAGPTDTCRITSALTNSPSTCEARSTSFTTSTNTIVLYEWIVRYMYGTDKLLTQAGTAPTMSFSDTCGGPMSTDDGASQPVSITLTVTDNLGATATATSGTGAQPPLRLRLFKC